MPFTLSEKHITDYHQLGYTVFEGIIPNSLLGDLRRVTDRAREIAYEVTGRQAQRLQPLDNYDLDLQPFKDYGELPELTDAMFQHGYNEKEVRGILGENIMRVAKQVWR